MTRRIAVVHGVGLDFSRSAEFQLFCDKLAEKTGAEVVKVTWNHNGTLPSDERKGPVFSVVRNFVHDILMDAAQAVIQLNQGTAPVQIPDADMYIGHSAGAIMVGTMKAGPRVLMGSPLQLLQNLNTPRLQTMAATEILNIMHTGDPLAARLNGAENVILDAPFSLHKYGPQRYIYEHCSYWVDSQVVELCVNRFKRTYTGD